MENTEAYKRDIRALLLLTDLVKDSVEIENPYEVILLCEFPTTNVIHPVEKFSPRQIIESMIEKHSFIKQSIRENPSNLKTLAFQYEIDAKPHVIAITNNMSFCADIQIICYYCIRILKFGLQNKLIEDIVKMLIDKYGINTEPQMNDDLDPMTITFHRIMYSFPSITLDIFDRDVGGYTTFYCNLFRDFDVPVGIFLPLTISILPSKLYEPPFAILLAISVKLDDLKNRDNPTPLATLYERITSSYASTVFPQKLKLYLCKKMNIVIEKEGEYFPDYPDNILYNNLRYTFNPNFKEYRDKAKSIILKHRLGSPSISNVLPCV